MKENKIIYSLRCHTIKLMLNLIEVIWVTGFALSTLLMIGLAAVRIYGSYADNMKVREREMSESMARQQIVIARWKRKVLRP
jgi:hypothetical protein